MTITIKAMPGYQVLVSHFHIHFNEQLTDAGTMDLQPSWLQVFRGLGINIAILADFHSDSHPNDPGPLRFKEQKVYFDGCRRFSDRGFLLIPGEEPDAKFGGHYITSCSRARSTGRTCRNQGSSSGERSAVRQGVPRGLAGGRVGHAASARAD